MPASTDYTHQLADSVINHISFSLSDADASSLVVPLSPTTAGLKVSLRHIFIERNNGLAVNFSAGGNQLINIPAEYAVVSEAFAPRINQATGNTLTIAKTGSGTCTGWIAVEVHL